MAKKNEASKKLMAKKRASGTNADNKKPEYAMVSESLFPIAAIGASTGGTEAISELIEHLQPDLGMAYIIVLHLAPDHRSALPELLKRRTNMPVSLVTDGMKIAPDQVYIIPPGSYMSVIDNTLALTPVAKAPNGHHVIDFFFTSLAKIYRNKAIGIILSGTATDGANGVQAIKAEGGITIAQDESAKFQGMPRHAGDSGFIDLVLSPAAIATELASIARTPYAIGAPDDTAIETNNAEIRKILILLHNKRGVDFAHYKSTTINRRILRRMALNRFQTLEEYTRMLMEHPAEMNMLYNDLLINVTSFFRDEELYLALSEKVFPALFHGRKPTDVVRIWIPACATGEEACSFAICLFEYLGDNALHTPIQIFATDLSDLAIEKARAGIYNRNAFENVSDQRLKRFFIKLDGHYQIVKPIRDICIFATHNLLKDPPFSRMDLISCQNVLIYLEAPAQKKIMQAFHYALKQNGVLLLGKSETIGNASELFTQPEKELKLYTKLATPANLHFDFTLRSQIIAPDLSERPQDMLVQQGAEVDVEREADRILLSHYVPPSLLINKDLQILRFHGPAFNYLQPSAGKASLHVLKMVREELVFELRTLLHRVKKDGLPEKKDGIPWLANGQMSAISIEVVPLKNPGSNPHYLIIFREVSPAQQTAADMVYAGSKEEKRDLKDKRIAVLELEVKEAREHMKTMSEEFEATREELQSANEEILSSNEELQSINEELETSKEELQSTNEELTTINEELQLRNTDLKESVTYREAIVDTMQEPLIVLNNDLRIHIANKAFYHIFRLAPEETEGNFFYETAGGLWDIPELRSQLSEIFQSNRSFLNFELSHNFPTIGDKVLLFSAIRMNQDDQNKSRYLLTIHDISERKRAEEMLLRSEQRYQTFIIQSTEGIWRYELEEAMPVSLPAKDQIDILYRSARLAECNDAMARMYGYNEARELIGTGVGDIIPRNSESESYLTQFIQAGYKLTNISSHEVDRNGKEKYFMNNLVGIIEQGMVVRIWGTRRDITEQRRAELDLHQAQEQLKLALPAGSVGTWFYNLKTNTIIWTKEQEALFGLGEGDFDRKLATWERLIHPDDLFKVRQILEDALMRRKEFSMEYRAVLPDGSYRWLMSKANVLRNDDGDAIRVAGASINITEQKMTEQQKDHFIGIASHELKTPVTSIKAYTEILLESFIDKEDTLAAELVQKLDKQVDRLTGLIKDLLDVTRISEGQLTLQQEYFDINDLIGETVEEMQRTSPRHHIIQKLAPASLFFGDRERIAQVLVNLLSNAIKYAPNADQVIITSSSDSLQVTIRIQDFGIGMESEMISKIFNRFYRVGEPAVHTFPV